MSDLPQEEVAPLADEGIYPIREVSRLTGVNAVNLRAWRRRYGLVQSARTEKGHRLYSEQDIRQIGERSLAADAGAVQSGAVRLQPAQGGSRSQRSLLASYPFELVCSRVLKPLVERLLGLWCLYDDEWLKTQGWQASLTELMVDAPATAGACGRGRKKS